MKMPLFSDLAQEWEQLAVSPAAVTALREWEREDAPLQGFADLRGVVFFAQRCGQRARGDEVLACLARRAPGDQLAAQALLQVVLYGLVRIAVDLRTATHSDEEIAAAVVAAAYERIRTYPIERRPRSIAANLLLDTRQSVSRSLCRRRVHEVLMADVSRYLEDDGAPSAADELLGLVDEAVRMRRLRRDDARLIVLTRVVGVPVAEVAAERGALPQSLRRRRLRAEAALASAVA